MPLLFVCFQSRVVLREYACASDSRLVENEMRFPAESNFRAHAFFSGDYPWVKESLLAVISADIPEHSNLTNSFILGQRQPSYYPPDDLFLKLSKCLDCLEERQQKPPIKSSGLFAKKPPCQPYGNLRKSGGKLTQDTLRALMVTKWVDYSNKYGFGAQLSDGSVTVRFNDSTKIAISPGKR